MDVETRRVLKCYTQFMAVTLGAELAAVVPLLGIMGEGDEQFKTS